MIDTMERMNFLRDMAPRVHEGSGMMQSLEGPTPPTRTGNIGGGRVWRKIADAVMQRRGKRV